jgi:hypothetical protein
MSNFKLGKWRTPHCSRSPSWDKPRPPLAERRAAAIAELYAECRQALREARERQDDLEFVGSCLGLIQHNRKEIRKFRGTT